MDEDECEDSCERDEDDDGLGLDPPGSNREDWPVDLDAEIPITDFEMSDDY